MLLVHANVGQLAITAQHILDHYDWPNCSLGSVLSQELLSVPVKKRPSQAKRAFTNTIRTHGAGPLLCTDIDLLFDPSLSLDALHLLREASRQTSIVVTWPGTFENGVLAYATHLHAHYQTWTQTDLLCDYCISTL